MMSLMEALAAMIMAPLATNAALMPQQIRVYRSSAIRLVAVGAHPPSPVQPPRAAG